MEVESDVHSRAEFLAGGLEVVHHLIDELLPLDILEGSAIETARLDLHGVHAGLFADRAIHPDAVAGRSTQKLVDGHAIHLALDVP